MKSIETQIRDNLRAIYRHSRKREMRGFDKGYTEALKRIIGYINNTRNGYRMSLEMSGLLVWLESFVEDIRKRECAPFIHYYRDLRRGYTPADIPRKRINK